MAFVVLYDANVLYPSTLRDLLIRVAQAGLVQARWTEQILDEVFGNLTANRPDLDPQKRNRTRELMNRAVRDCIVTGPEPLIGSIDLPDPGDRHVLAAAIKSRVRSSSPTTSRTFHPPPSSTGSTSVARDSRRGGPADRELLWASAGVLRRRPDPAGARRPRGDVSRTPSVSAGSKQRCGQRGHRVPTSGPEVTGAGLSRACRAGCCASASPPPTPQGRTPQPPSTSSVCPVTQAASSDSSQATAGATSAGRPQRPEGIRAATARRPSSSA